MQNHIQDILTRILYSKENRILQQIKRTVIHATQNEQVHRANVLMYYEEGQTSFSLRPCLLFNTFKVIQHDVS